MKFVKIQNLFWLNLVFSLIAFWFINGCKETVEQNADPSYLSEIEQWHSVRIANLKKENGWLNLAGLFWLKVGENKFGSEKDNDIVFPQNSPAYIGTITLKDTIVSVKINSGVKVFSNNTEVKELILQNDLSGNPTVLKLDSLLWFVIKRGDKFGIRLRDLNSPLLKEFTGIERFPVNKNWRIEANYIPYSTPQKTLIPNVLGGFDEEIVPGKLVFKIQDKQYELDPVDSGRRLFIIFADETNGETTYGAGRFLYTDKPDSLGKVILDFNKSYNPPCVFTRYATCPLPPAQNHLAVKITAGEKMYGSHE